MINYITIISSVSILEGDFVKANNSSVSMLEENFVKAIDNLLQDTGISIHQLNQFYSSYKIDQINQLNSIYRIDQFKQLCGRACSFCGIDKSRCVLPMDVHPFVKYSEQISIMKLDRSVLDQFIILLIWYGYDGAYYETYKGVSFDYIDYIVYKYKQVKAMDNHCWEETLLLLE